MNFITVKKPVYANEAKSAINCIVLFEGWAEPVPFTASADDVERHGLEIFARCQAGEFGTVGKYVAPKVDNIALADRQRAALFAEVTIAIAPLQDAHDLGIATDEETTQLNAWKRYRVQLNRIDIAKAPEIEWPDMPHPL